MLAPGPLHSRFSGTLIARMAHSAPTLYLASASPRRRELLEQIGLFPEAIPTDVDESAMPNEAPAELVARLALGKARSGLSSIGTPTGALVIGADTIVVLENTVFGKPVQREDALSMLSRLSGRTHCVMTAVALCDATGHVQASSVTKVSMRPISADEMRVYWDTGEPIDKAGAYAIQGLGAQFVSGIRGSYSGVVGLPLYETAALLSSRGIKLI